MPDELTQNFIAIDPVTGKILQVQFNVNVVVIDTAGNNNYIPNANAKSLIIECIGAGGGGGSTDGTTSAGTVCCGGGGGGGAYSRTFIAGPLAAAYTVAVGAGGAGGVPPGTPAVAGGDTIFETVALVVLCKAQGGAIGGQGNRAAPPIFSATGGVGGSALNGTGLYKADGGSGGIGIGLAGAQLQGGANGAAGLSPAQGGRCVSGGVATAGQGGSAYGSGGGGAIGPALGNANGGAGFKGACIITEIIQFQA